MHLRGTKHLSVASMAGVVYGASRRLDYADVVVMAWEERFSIRYVGAAFKNGKALELKSPRRLSTQGMDTSAVRAVETSGLQFVCPATPFVRQVGSSPSVGHFRRQYRVKVETAESQRDVVG